MLTFYFWASHAKRQFLWPIRLSRKKESITFTFIQCLTFCCSVAQSCPAVCSPVDCSTPAFPVLHYSRNLLKFISIESVILSNHLILCHPLILPSVFPNIGVFSNKLALWIKWPKYWPASVFAMNIQGWLPLGLTGLICLQSKGLSRVFSSTTIWKHQFFSTLTSLRSPKPTLLLILTFPLSSQTPFSTFLPQWRWEMSDHRYGIP